MHFVAAVFVRGKKKMSLYYICVMYCLVISNVSITVLPNYKIKFIDVAFLLYCTCLFYIEQLFLYNHLIN